MTMRGHRGKVRAVAYSPDGKTVFTGSDDSTGRLWDAATNKTIGPPLLHQGLFVAVAYSPDGKSFLTVSSDHTVRIWDAEAGQPFGRSSSIKMRARPWPIARTVGRSSADWGRQGDPLGRGHRTPHRAVHADSRPGTDRGLQSRWQVGPHRMQGRDGPALGRLRPECPSGPALRHQGGVTVVAFSPDGKSILTGGEGSVRLWDAAAGAAPIGKPLPQPGSVDAAAFSPDGNSFVSGCDSGSAQVWDVADRSPRGQPFPHPGCISSAAFSPDGKALLTGCEDGAARLWDVASGRLRVPPLRHQAWVFAVAFSPRRQDGAHREPGQDGAVLGRGDRPADRPAFDTSRRDLERGVQPRRQVDPDRMRLRCGAALPECPGTTRRSGTGRRLGGGPHRIDPRCVARHHPGPRQRSLCGTAVSDWSAGVGRRIPGADRGSIPSRSAQTRWPAVES